MNDAFLADRADGVIKFAAKTSRKHHQPDMRYCPIICAEVEELIADIHLFIMHARNNGDAFEYYRLCEELRLAEAARADSTQLIITS